MKDRTDSRPSIVDELKQRLLESERRATDSEARAVNSEARVRHLEEKLQLALARLYGRKTEKHFSPAVEQAELLFDEIEVRAESPDSVVDKTTVEAHTRRKGGGRKPLPDSLPRVEIVHDLSETAKVCACGTALKRIGEEVSERLELIPAKAQVLREIRPKYACPGCEGTDDPKPAVRVADLPPRLLPKSIATPGLLAHIVTSKFVDGLPLYRQSKMLTRHGIELSDGKMSRWLVKVAVACSRLRELFVRQLLSSAVIGVDETHLQVLKEPGRKDSSRSWAWVIRSMDFEHPGTLFLYSTSRSAQFITETLKDYRGTLVTDGYAGYNELGRREEICHAGCWAHARRKFDEAIKGFSGKKRKKGTLAEEALSRIRQLYLIEKQARDQLPEERLALRQEKALPVLYEFHDWLQAAVPRTPPKGALGEAIAYTLGQWRKLIVYTEDPLIPIDNNLTENAIRPFVIGRKNWLFAGSPAGAQASALFYSLVETARSCGLEPYAYLRELFERLPYAQSDEDLAVLLPKVGSPEH
ncbi:MAG: IS66 family transposase [Sulfuricella denitrificans]|nr:IS66 family transposase [Sulfuricella denitrificans]